MIPMEYIVPRLRIVVIIEMMDVNVVEEILSQLLQLEEEFFVAGFHQSVEKQRKKACHDQHINRKQFEVRGIVLMYDKKFLKHPGKLKTHWLGSYIVMKIIDGAVKLQKLDETEVQGLVNGSQLKPYHNSCDLVTLKGANKILCCFLFADF